MILERQGLVISAERRIGKTHIGLKMRDECQSGYLPFYMVEGDTVMRPGFLRSSRYSPGNMDRESLEALFVGRHDIMEDVLSRVTTSIRGTEKHYVLLVGPRGSGKTHFLALAYHRLLDRFDRAGARDGVAVALLNEEEWGVASFLDLLVRILRALAGRAPDLDAEIAGIYDRFSKDPADAETFAVALLRQHTRGKTLLLLCENLVDLFHGLNEEGQKRWRATIQEDGNWSMESLASSLADLPDCRIPVEMLQVAVRYTKTGDDRHMLSLPLEQRQLLEDVLPPAASERAGRA